MWAHYALWMLSWDDQAWQVSLIVFLKQKIIFCLDILHSCCTSFAILCRYICPICSKSVIDMSRTWKRLDEEVSSLNLCLYWGITILVMALIVKLFCWGMILLSLVSFQNPFTYSSWLKDEVDHVLRWSLLMIETVSILAETYLLHLA